MSNNNNNNANIQIVQGAPGFIRTVDVDGDIRFCAACAVVLVRHRSPTADVCTTIVLHGGARHHVDGITPEQVAAIIAQAIYEGRTSEGQPEPEPDDEE